MPKVSIIVPVYNVEKYLVECLKSLIKQTLKDIEIICVNDGSTDSSLQILEKFAKNDARIKILNKDNGGQSSARNYGIKSAEGEYIGFVDSDDWVDKNYFEKLYNTAKKYNADIACAGFRRFVCGCGSIRKKFKNEITATDINEKVDLANISEHSYIWDKIYRREKWINSGIKFPEGRKFEDIAIVLKTLNMFDKFVTVPNTYYHYRRRKNSTVAQQDTKAQNDHVWAKEQMLQYAKENNITLKKTDNPKTTVIRIFGIKTFKIKQYKARTEILLFGIPIIKISEK